jgi:recombination protein RecA
MATAAASATLAALETALRNKKLDRTLTTALPPLERTDPAALTPTDLPPLDTLLRGGLPRGQLSELAGPASSGRTTVLMQLLAASTRRDEIVALVDASDCLDVASAAAAGVDLDRVLWIRGSTVAAGSRPGPHRSLESRPGPRPVRRSAEREGGPVHRSAQREGGSGPGGGAGGIAGGIAGQAIERAVKALNLVLQAGGFSIVALDLGDVSLREIKSLPHTTWLRVQRAIEGSDTACVLIVPEPIARSAGGLTLTLTGASRWDGMSAQSRRLAGADVQARVISPRRRVDGSCHLAFGI